MLCFLRERPMHPYELQRLVRERHKDEVLVLKRGSLYHAINRLYRTHLIEPVGTSRIGRRPERTTYRITPEGRRVLIRRLRDLIAIPRLDPREFMAAVSYLLHLTPRDTIRQLEQRAGLLEKQIVEFDQRLKVLVLQIGRLNLIESEYARALCIAELQWVRFLVDELHSGRLTWDIEKILRDLRASHQQVRTRESRSESVKSR